MGKKLLIIVLVALNCQFVTGKPVNDIDKIKSLEEKCAILQDNQVKAENDLLKLTEEQGESERCLRKITRLSNWLLIVCGTLVAF